QTCGLVQSILVTMPLILTTLLESNSAAKEWCAIKGILAAVIAATIIKPKTMRLIVTLLKECLSFLTGNSGDLRITGPYSLTGLYLGQSPTLDSVKSPAVV